MSLTKKNMLIIAGLAVGGLGVAGLLAEGSGDGGENIQEKIRQRAGNILGTTGNGEAGTTTYNIPARGDIVFPGQEAAFDWGAWLNSQLGEGENGAVTETGERDTARRGGGGGDFAYAESIPYPADVTKKESLISSALGESYAAQGKGLGGLTAFRETKAALPSKVRGEPTPRISKKEGARAPVEAAIGYVSSGASGLWGAMSRSYAAKGKGMSSSVKAASTKKKAAPPKKRINVTITKPRTHHLGRPGE